MVFDPSNQLLLVNSNKQTIHIFGLNATFYTPQQNLVGGALSKVSWLYNKATAAGDKSTYTLKKQKDVVGCLLLARNSSILLIDNYSHGKITGWLLARGALDLANNMMKDKVSEQTILNN